MTSAKTDATHLVPRIHFRSQSNDFNDLRSTDMCYTHLECPGCDYRYCWVAKPKVGHSRVNRQ
jgi:hypothetical protein